MIVFKNGIPQGSKVSIPFGGHIQPIWTAGTKLEWKKAQKKAKKNIASETINKTIPKDSPFCTAAVWCPSKVASRTISLNQKNNIKHVEIKKQTTKNNGGNSKNEKKVQGINLSLCK